MTPTQPQRRGGWVDFDPRAPWIGVAWGDSPAYALVARLRADAYAVENRLIVVDRVASYGPDPVTVRLLDVAEACAYAWHAGQGWAWWLVSAHHVRLTDVDRIKAAQRRVWSTLPNPRPSDPLPRTLYREYLVSRESTLRRVRDAWDESYAADWERRGLTDPPTPPLEPA